VLFVGREEKRRSNAGAKSDRRLNQLSANPAEQ
jgi:hypothetical protein